MESAERIDAACVHHMLQISQHHNDESTLQTLLILNTNARVHTRTHTHTITHTHAHTHNNTHTHTMMCVQYPVVSASALWVPTERHVAVSAALTVAGDRATTSVTRTLGTVMVVRIMCTLSVSLAFCLSTCFSIFLFVYLPICLPFCLLVTPY